MWSSPTSRSSRAARVRGRRARPARSGSALGIAILGTVLFLTLTNRFDSALTDLGVPEAQRVQLVDAVESSAGAVIPGLAANPATATVAAAAESAYTDATRLSALVAAGFLVIGLGASASLGRGRRPDDPSETVTVTTSEEPA